MASKKGLDDCVFDFDGEGEGGFFRVKMTNRDGELNRPVMVNKGEKFLIVARLLDVVHGKLNSGGDDGTLLIANFLFLPSGGKRFVEANITWTFTSDDPAVEVAVADVAPVGGWSLNPVTLKLETNVGTNASIGPKVGPVQGNLGADFARKQAKDLEYHTLVDGGMRMEERNKGGFDSVRWNLKENEKDRRGICRMLQVGVLLRRTVLPGMTPRADPTPTFRGAVNITVDKGFWSEVQRVWKNTEKDDAIVFQPGVDRVSGDFDIQKDNLGSLSLRDDIMYISLHESFDGLKKEREERKRKRREDEGKKKQDEEEKKKQEKDDRGKQEDEHKKPSGVDAPAVGTASTVAQPQDGARATTPAKLPPTWLYYVILGMLGMYLWQQLAKTLFDGN